MEIRIREVAHKDKETIESIIRSNENFTDEEKYCAAELLDFYLRDITKGEYIFVCAALNPFKSPLNAVRIALLSSS